MIWISCSPTPTGSSRSTRAACSPTARRPQSRPTGASSTRSSAGARGPGERPAVLTVDALDVFIQASHILRSVSLDVGPREVVCLVGRNGAGKTTTLRTIMGDVRPHAGRGVFRGQPIHARRTHELAQLGVGGAPYDNGIFAVIKETET